MEFLTANTKSDSRRHKNGNFIDATGKDVVVIGGGDTGTDCVGTSMRHGCKSLVQVEILPQPPMERPRTIPGPNGRKVTRWIMARKKPLQSSAPIRASISPPRPNLKAMRMGTSKRFTRCKSSGRRTKKASSFPRTCPARKRCCPRNWCCWQWASSDRNSRCWKRSASNAMRAPSESRFREIQHEHSESVCLRRLPARPEPGGLGVQRRPRCGPRMRPVFDGFNGSAIK